MTAIAVTGLATKKHRCTFVLHLLGCKHRLPLKGTILLYILTPTAFHASDLAGMQLQDTPVQHSNQTVLHCLHTPNQKRIGNQQDSPLQGQPAVIPD